MRLSYGAYTHVVNELGITFQRTAIPEKREGAQVCKAGYRDEWRISGKPIAATQNLLITACDALDAAYADDGKDLIFLGADLVTVARQMLSADSTTGTMVTSGPNYPDNGTGTAEFTTWRTYDITVVAEYVDEDGSDLPSDTLIFQETLSITGTSGPEFVVVPILNGKWPVQRLYQRSGVKATQQGNAVGRTGYPSPPGPIFGDWEHLMQREISKESPKRTGTAAAPTYTEWPISWAYHFEANTGLSGDPNQGA